MKDLTGKLKLLKATQIEVRNRARQEFNEKELLLLGADIAQYGLHHALVLVDKVKAGIKTESLNTSFLLLAGERRLRGIKAWVRKAREEGTDIPPHMLDIPCKVYEREMSDKEIGIIELHENIQRKDFTFQEAAQLTKAIHEELTDVAKRDGAFAHQQKDTAAFIGKSPATVNTDLDIAKALEGKLGEALKQRVSKATNKAKAVKMISEEKKRLAAAELARRMRKRKEEEGEETFKQRVCDSYRLMSYEDGMAMIEDRSIDFIELDPDYGIDFKSSGPVRQGERRESADDYIEIAPEEYEEKLREYATEAFRVLKDNSWMVVWYSIADWHDTTRKILEEVGFKVAPIPAFWLKDSGNSSTPAFQLANDLEFFFYCRKGSPRIISMGRSNVYRYRTPRSNERFHPAEKPVELYEEILRTFVREGSKVVVGFAGSGNAILAAYNNGCEAVGFDLSKTFQDKFTVKVMGSPKRFSSYKSEA